MRVNDLIAEGERLFNSNNFDEAITKLNLALNEIEDCNQSLKMRNKETNRDLAEFFGNKWDGCRLNGAWRCVSPFFIERKIEIMKWEKFPETPQFNR